MADNQEFSKFTLTSKKDPISGAYSIASYDKDVRAFLNAVKSALPKDAFFSVGEKELNKQGKLKIDIYTHKEEANLVRKALDERAGDLYFKGSTEEKYKITKARQLPDSVQESLRREESDKINKENRAEGEKTRKAITGTALKVIGAVTVLTDIARRILSSVLTMSTQAIRDATTAHNLGMTYGTMRELSNLETAHGITKGTFSGALSDIQSKFGNITDIDENALGSLALVMGSEIESLVKSGIGGERPEALLGSILDAYNERANAGYNSIGQYVGEVEARRELYSQLNKVSPQIAELFATMQEERNNVNSIYRKQADTFDEWRRLFNANRGGFTTADYGVVETLGQYTNQIAGIAEQIKQGVMIKLAPKLADALQKISNWRIGMTERDSWEMDDRNRQANKDFIAQIDRQLEMFPEIEGFDPLLPSVSYEDRISQSYRATLLNAKAKAEKQNKKLSGVGDATKTLNQLMVSAINTAQSDYETAYVLGEVRAPYSEETMWEVVNRLLQTGGISTEEIEFERQRVIKTMTDEKVKSELEDRQRRKKEIVSTMAVRPYSEIRQALQEAGLESAPYEVKTGWFGKTKTVIDDYTKELSDSEKQYIMESLSEDEINSRLIQSLFDLYGESKGLDYSAYRLGKEDIKKLGTESEAYAMSLLGGEQSIFDKAQGYLGTYGFVGGTDAGGTYRIVLDINKDGKIDKSDIVLWEGQGFRGFQGQFSATATVGNNDIKINYSNALQQSASETR